MDNFRRVPLVFLLQKFTKCVKIALMLEVRRQTAKQVLAPALA
jgi:hypothetical protein